MKRRSRNFYQLLLFVLVITGLSLVYDYPETLMKRPQSIHNWRQCDGASLALNYYQEGMHFFKPQTHMLYSDGYTTGFTTTSEIPVLYYFVALLYKIFGYHDFIFRAVNLLFFFIGLFYLFRLADAILKNLFYALVVTVLIFSSPLLVYYGNNFMPNKVALSFSFVGWYYFYQYYTSKKSRIFFLSILFFGIAGALKITELTGPIIVLLLLISEKLKLTRFGLEIGKHYGYKIVSILILYTIVGGWVLYAKHYNAQHMSSQFSTYTFPIWGMSQESIAFTLHKMKVIWFKDYFYPATFWFMVAGLILMLVLYRKSNRLLLPVVLLYTGALVAFSLLWFNALGDHDYFFIGFYVLPAFVFINFFHILLSVSFGKTHARIIQIVFVLVVAMNVYYAKERHSLRYERSWMNDFQQVKDLYTIKPWLDETEIGPDDTVIFYPSLYIRPLYLMNLKGWTIFNHDSATVEIEKRDSALMKTFTTNGAEFFITNDIKSAVSYRPFQPYLKDLYAKYNSIFIFRLPPKSENFNPADSVLMRY